MEEEFKNMTLVWLTVLASLTYCYVMSKLIPKGITRLCFSIPVLFLFLYLPLNLNTFILATITSFFISWLANFRLILFAFGKGPLSKPSLSFLGFLLLAFLPIRIKDSHQESLNKVESSTLSYAVKTLLFSIICGLYFYRDSIHPKLLLVVHFFIIYLVLEPVSAGSGILARALARLELEPEFVKPYLATSLQNFWGKRWNLVVVSTLRPTVYEPVRSVATALVGRKRAYFPAVLATFLVSGVMHEVIFYHMGRMKPSWEVTAFFVLHGVCVAVEISAKKAFGGRFSVPQIVSGPLVILFVAVTSCELLILPVMKQEIIEAKTRREGTAIAEFVKKICFI